MSLAEGVFGNRAAAKYSFADIPKPTIYIYIYRRLGGEPNREIDFGFGSCVRARGGCQVKSGQQMSFASFPFSLLPQEVFPFPLWDLVSSSEFK